MGNWSKVSEEGALGLMAVAWRPAGQGECHATIGTLLISLRALHSPQPGLALLLLPSFPYVPTTLFLFHQLTLSPSDLSTRVVGHPVSKSSGALWPRLGGLTLMYHKPPWVILHSWV